MNNRERHPTARIPIKDYETIFNIDESIYSLQPCIVHPQMRSGNINLFEIIILDLICLVVRPGVLIEFGTFNGRTTLNLAANTPENTIITTVDLPMEKIKDTQKPLEQRQNFADIDELGYIGLKNKLYDLQDYKLYRKKINQIWCDSADFNKLYPNFLQKTDMVFVDASHSYENALNDSLTACKLIKPGGWIFWHDYNGWPGVTDALNHVYDTIGVNRMYHILGTSIVSYQSPEEE